MLTANEAKRIADESPCDYLTEIDKIIEMNAKLGLYECCYELTAHKTVADNIAATLEELGYSVEVTLHPSLTESFSHLIYIRWNDPLTTVTKQKKTRSISITYRHLLRHRDKPIRWIEVSLLKH